MTFQDYQKGLIPVTNPDDPLATFEEVLGIKKDEAASGARAAVKSAFIQTAPVDALQDLGINFDTPKPEILTDEQYRAKLAKSWDRWTASGTVNNLIAELKELGFVNIGIVPVWTLIGPNQYVNTLGIDEINPDMQNFWSSFWVVIDKPHGYQVVNWGVPNWGQFLWGEVTGDKVKLARAVAIIKQLKPAWTSCRGIVFVQGTEKLWDTFNWGTNLFGASLGVFRIKENWEEV